MLTNQRARMFFALLAISILCSGTAAAQPLSPRPTELSQPNEPQPAPSEQQSAGGPPSGATEPAATKTVPSTNATPEAAKKPDAHDDKASNERLLMIWTAVLAVVTGLLVVIAGIQAYFFWYQLGLMRIGVEDAAIAAIAARDNSATTRESLELSRLTTTAQLRAYIVIHGGSMVYSDLAEGGRGVVIRVDLKNSGQTPAYKFTTWISPPEILDASAVPWGKPIDQRGGHSIVGPNTLTHVTWVLPISDADLDAINKGQRKIFAWGGANYTDSFGKERYFTFRTRNSDGSVNAPGGGWSLSAQGEEGD